MSSPLLVRFKNSFYYFDRFLRAYVGAPFTIRKVPYLYLEIGEYLVLQQLYLQAFPALIASTSAG
jgi:hypothetical protein